MEIHDWNAAELSRRSGVSARGIGMVINSERGCSVEMADRIAKAFGLDGWHLLNPNLPDDLVNSSLSKLIDNYAKASAESKKFIEDVAEREAARGEK